MGMILAAVFEKEGVNFDPEVKYANHPELFTLKLHHGGDFTDEDDFEYGGGKVDYIDNVNSDMFSLIVMNDMLLAFGYSEEDVVVYHFRVPGEDLMLGLRPLGTDSDVLRMISYVEKNKVLDVYIQHVRRFSKKDVEKEPEYVDLSDEGSYEGSDQQDEDNEDSDQQDEDSDQQDEDSESESVDGSYEGSCEGSAGEGEKVEGVETTPSKRVKSFHRKSVKAKNRKNRTDKVGQDEDDEDPDYIFDKDNVVEDYSVDMKEYYAEVDADISEQYEQQVDVDEDDEQVDLDGFESLTDADGDTALERACRSVRKDKRRSKTSGECPFYLDQSVIS
ncbi:hypothetical protein HanPI659440_Chr04g0144771 [Helianthus annuus]|nr:hypothetical protein HanPI659440_Chr04g0144771 [Helianthus annuus]